MDENRKESKFILAENISAKWWTIGHLIKMTMNTLKGYEKEFNKDNSRCWAEVMQRWMEGQGNNIYPQTWDGLYKLLKDANSPQVAVKLQKAVENALF